MKTSRHLQLRSREPRLHQAASADKRLNEHVRRALNKIKKPSTAEEIAELLNQELDPGDGPFQAKEVATCLRSTNEHVLSLYWLDTRPRR